MQTYKSVGCHLELADLQFSNPNPAQLDGSGANLRLSNSNPDELFGSGASDADQKAASSTMAGTSPELANPWLLNSNPAQLFGSGASDADLQNCRLPTYGFNHGLG